MSYMFVPSTNVSLHMKHPIPLKSCDVVTGRALEMEPGTRELQMRRVRTRARKGRVHVATRGLGGAKPGAWDTVGKSLSLESGDRRRGSRCVTHIPPLSIRVLPIRRILEMHRLSGECDD